MCKCTHQAYGIFVWKVILNRWKWTLFCGKVNGAAVLSLVDTLLLICLSFLPKVALGGIVGQVQELLQCLCWGWALTASTSQGWASVLFVRNCSSHFHSPKKNNYTFSQLFLHTFPFLWRLEKPLGRVRVFCLWQAGMYLSYWAWTVSGQLGAVQYCYSPKVVSFCSRHVLGLVYSLLLPFLAWTFVLSFSFLSRKVSLNPTRKGNG